MIFSEKLVVLRKNKGMTQDALAEKLNVSRQAVAKWESGQAYPDISNLIQISDLMNVTVDYLVRDGECMMNVLPGENPDLDQLIQFRLEANVNTYAAFMNEVASTRLDSHDFRYENGDYVYHDTYVGGEQFAGEEAVWKSGKSVYAMNYLGRVLSKEFSGNFLKDALRHADKKMPYRGPEHYEDGEYIYKCSVNGNFEWFQGYEEIFWREKKVYECYFHGGLTR
ncbi:MAG: helix-turn-helix transcriptional regulator [Treponema sp.]|nr:helix-turn-helix transcriptional regulator [Treponema sp.]MBQ1714647.1 helix-turn-helix transcriptional regulator [Treponema sp.]MBQ2464862.1 helix-turn-helix transcriptional regulator [Treponema sp.]MBQ5449380.1 helix-turn-helix transcriptional regulator [Treponema sp.]MBQ5499698.1 helix-turn-helix transcriptional regulator [Treponema sp.]